jgi:hypothetical protein
MIKPYDSFNDLYKEGEEAAYVRRQQPKSVPAPNKVSGSETRPVFEKKPSLPEHFTARPKRCWRILLVFTACLQVFCAGGLLLGWPVVSSMAAEEGFDAKYVHDVFVFACTANMIAQLVSGWILDRFGPRVCSASCIFQVMVGSKRRFGVLEACFNSKKQQHHTTPWASVAEVNWGRRIFYVSEFCFWHWYHTLAA